jgi:AcrR family transcriptional regulator
MLSLNDELDAKPVRKRQARGEHRIASLLDAAEYVFGRVGYHNATTNAIAEKAEVSPATLYQFFPNKDAMAEALAIKYSNQLTEIHISKEQSQRSDLPLEQLVDSIIDPVCQFHADYPAFQTILVEAKLSAQAVDAKHHLSEVFINRFALALLKRNQKISEVEAKWVAEICLVIFKGFLPFITACGGEQKIAAQSSLKEVLIRYLEPKFNS